VQTRGRASTMPIPQQSYALGLAGDFDDHCKGAFSGAVPLANAALRSSMMNPNCVHGVVLIDYLCHAWQKQLVDIDITREIAKPLQDSGDSTYFRLRNATGRLE